MRSSSCNHMVETDEIRCATGTAHGPERPYPVLTLGDLSIFPKTREQARKIKDEIQRWLDTVEPFQSELSEKDKQVAKLVMLGRILPPDHDRRQVPLSNVSEALVTANGE